MGKKNKMKMKKFEGYGYVLVICVIATLMSGCIQPEEPVVEIFDIDSGWINTSNVNVTFRACDDADDLLDCTLTVKNSTGGVYYTWSGDVICEPVKIPLALLEGLNALNLECTDDAGNTGNAEPLNLWVDTKAPTVEWLDFPG